jgi:hypothetical protein
MGKMKLKQFDLLKIDWVDSLSDESGWTSLENYDYDDLYLNLIHQSVGYLIRESNKAITVAHSIRGNKTFMLGVITIPKGCIKRITKIKTRSKNHAGSRNS